MNITVTQDKVAKRLTTSMLILIAGYALTNTSMSVMMNQIVEEYSLVSAQQGLMNSMLSFGAILAILLIPFFQGRIKKTTMLIAASLMQVIMMALMGSSASFVLLLAACVLLGIGGGWTDAYTNSGIVDINRENSAKYMGALHGWYGVGAFLTPLLVMGLLSLTGWRNTYYLLTILVLAVALQFIITIRLFKRNALEVATDQESPLKLSEIKQLLHDKVNTLLLVCAMLYVAGQNGMLSFVVRYMTVTYSAEALGAAAVSLFWLCSFLSRFFAPRLPVRPLKLLIGGLFISFAANVVGVLAGSPVAFFIACGVMGLSSGHSMPMLLHETLSRYPGKTSLPTSAMLLGMKFPMMLMPLAVGALSAVFSLSIGMLLGAGATLLAALVALWAFLLRKKEIQQG